MKAKVTQCEAVRRLLAPGTWVRHLDMRQAGGTRFGARLDDLKRKHGYRWEVRYRNGSTWYRRVR